MDQYLNLVRDVVDNGNVRIDRTGTGTVSVFGRQLRFDLSRGFPLLTTKKMFLRGLVEETLWMLRGSTNNKELTDLDVHIWDDWAVREEDKENYPEVAVGELGPVYGEQWRTWKAPTNTQTRFKLPARLDMAEYMISMNLTEGKYTLEDLHNLRATYADGADHPDVRRSVYDCLTRWGIPQDINDNRTIDQISELIKGLKERPYSRRHLVSAWNVADLPDETKSPQQNAVMGKMALAPCHTLFQFYVRNRKTVDMWVELDAEGKSLYTEFIERRGSPRGGVSFDLEYQKKVTEFFTLRGINTRRLDCQLYQRSADLVLGVPFNIASYALLTMMVAQCVGMLPGDFIHTFGDVHIYSNHLKENEQGESIYTQMDRRPGPLPKMKINPAVTDIFGFKIDDFTLEGYEPHPSIKFKVAV